MTKCTAQSTLHALASTIGLGALTTGVPSPLDTRPQVAEPAGKQVTLLTFPGPAVTVQPPGPGPLPGRLPHSPLELEADTVAVLQDSHEGLGVILGRPPEGQALGQPLNSQQPWLPE